MVAVGATCVARIHATYDSGGDPHRRAGHGTHTYEQPMPVESGGELGMFEMGSTVILVFEPGRVKWDESLQPGAPVRLGQRIGARP